MAHERHGDEHDQRHVDGIAARRGAAAVYLQGNTGATPAQVASALSTAATPNVVGNPGAGSPNKLLCSDPGGGDGNPDPEPTPSPTPTPAPGCGSQASSGTLSGRGAEVRIEYTTTARGAHNACLTGPSGTDFDVALQRNVGGSWQTVAISQRPSNTETVEHTGPAGQYRWRVYSYSGSGGLHAELAATVSG